MSEFTLILIRGIPGSGKSTLAKKMVNDSKTQLVHLEADMFFVDDKGVYLFQPHLTKQAHQWCQNRCSALLKGKNSVVVSNTFIKLWEMKVYRDLAIKYNAKLVIKTCDGNYKNIHEVPEDTVKKMQQQWQN